VTFYGAGMVKFLPLFNCTIQINAKTECTKSDTTALKDGKINFEPLGIQPGVSRLQLKCELSRRTWSGRALRLRSDDVGVAAGILEWPVRFCIPVPMRGHLAGDHDAEPAFCLLATPGRAKTE